MLRNERFQPVDDVGAAVAQVVEDQQVVPGLRQRNAGVRADKAGTAGDEDQGWVSVVIGLQPQIAQKSLRNYHIESICCRGRLKRYQLLFRRERARNTRNAENISSIPITTAVDAAMAM